MPSGLLRKWKYPFTTTRLSLQWRCRQNTPAKILQVCGAAVTLEEVRRAAALQIGEARLRTSRCFRTSRFSKTWPSEVTTGSSGILPETAEQDPHSARRTGDRASLSARNAVISGERETACTLSLDTQRGVV